MYKTCAERGKDKNVFEKTQALLLLLEYSKPQQISARWEALSWQQQEEEEEEEEEERTNCRSHWDLHE